MALVITRHKGESFTIFVPNMPEIEVKVLSLNNINAKIAIIAPEEYQILREEIIDEYRCIDEEVIKNGNK